MAIRNGNQYRGGLKDGRCVWMGGRRVDDVATHPALAGPVDTIAALYDLQDIPGFAEILTRAANGEIIPKSMCPPRSADDLAQRGTAFRVAAAETFGLMGRAPDFVNVMLTAFSSAADYFGAVDPRFRDNIRSYHRWCQLNDAFVTHASINPQTDRSKGSAAQSDSTAHLKVVDQNAAGVVVHGAKMIATLTPIADEILVFPMPGYQPGDEAYTAAFAIPANHAGVSIVCREAFGDPLGRNTFDHPLARFDEIDAMVVFDGVTVPWERVFLLGSVEKANGLYSQTTAQHHTGHQGVIRGLAKAELLCGIAVELAESANTSTYLHVQEMLGEILSLLEIYRGAVRRVEDEATMSRWGTMTPSINAVRAIRYHFPKACSRMIEVIQILGGGSLLATPAQNDLRAAAHLSPTRFFGTYGDGYERIGLLKLAWDATGDSHGQRQALYERNLAGDPVQLAATQYRQFDTTGVKDTVRRALRTADATAGPTAAGSRKDKEFTTACVE
ncbi:4-hydroxyphenylacetate 3-monooxygenase oxygenase component [Mycolicibacterium madagascariense]|uniref:4-hydroxyphenylacetate 3-monooxygenase oxygenase component n=1 Tax=Mycolicibacterium madagascariense TaxID=212765 RepID=A0A7I7XI54_9MYCO|nr:4-hydroxyphenylacetate 3-hydroxylase N-terminal domain-containing protein [Mycolicibacterium madagascariense]MCV7012774.1 4-hydroxyphenylacetate 3-monooxygenase [Mycolicibacterium madagascariense]BBZ28891.1 4-hydroxyphenylacetate 3-monooxygenase oxygenase component [Mycolicibacterium madagascariense]